MTVGRIPLYIKGYYITNDRVPQAGNPIMTGQQYNNIALKIHRLYIKTPETMHIQKSTLNQWFKKAQQHKDADWVTIMRECNKAWKKLL